MANEKYHFVLVSFVLFFSPLLSSVLCGLERDSMIKVLNTVN